MRTTQQIEREARQLYRLCLINRLLDENRTRQVIRRVIESKRRGYFSLLAQFQRLVRLDREAHTAAVESAAPLSADLQSQVESRLERTYGAGIKIFFSQNPALIGGMRIKVGSHVYDGSVKSELDALERSF